MTEKYSPRPDEWAEAEAKVNEAERSKRKAAKAGSVAFIETGKADSERIVESEADILEKAKRPRVAKKAMGTERTETFKSEELMGEAESLERTLAGFRMQNLIRALREDHGLERQEKNIVDEETKLLKSIEAEPSGVELEALADIRQEQERIAMQRQELFASSPEAYFGLHLRDLKKYKEQLASGKIVETPYVQEQAEDIVAHLRANRPVLIYGHLGSGKTELAMHIARTYIGKEALVVSGSKYTSLAELYGHQVLTVDKESGSTVTDYFLGPVYRAMEEGRPVIIDEVNAIPHEVLISLNHILTRKPGDVVNVQQDSGKQITVQDGFGILMTGNLNQGQETYVDRQDMDPAFLSRLYKKEYDYLPQATEGSLEDEAGGENELFHLLLSRCMDDNGNLQAPPDTLRKLWRLSQAARVTQNVFAGKETNSAYYFREGGGRGVKYLLKESVMSLRAIDAVIGQWQKEGQAKELDYYLWKEFVSQSTIPSDRAYLYQLLKDQFGFFKSEGWPQAPDYGSGGNIRSFDLKPPANAGGATEFMGPREIVVAGFDRPPERAQWPEVEMAPGTSPAEISPEVLTALEGFKAAAEKDIEQLAKDVDTLCEITKN